MQKTIKYFICISLSVLIQSCNAQVTNPNASVNNYLIKPGGPYGVGFKDYHYVTNICPDFNYTGSNSNYFSPGNQGGSGTNFCHEIMARIYYPSNIQVMLPTTPYYKPAILQQLASLNYLDPALTAAQLENFSSQTSWTIQNAPVSLGKFPVILFSPGFSEQAQTYENNITELVSNGYIVVAIDSVFISGDIGLPDGTIVPNVIPAGYPSESAQLIIFQNEYPEQLNDIAIMYQQINNLNNQTDPVFAQMDLSDIGGFGHSLGGLAIVNTANLHPDWFKVISPLDEGFDDQESSSPIESVVVSPVSIPILYQWSAYNYFLANSLGLSWPLLNDNSNVITLTSNLTNTSYTMHENFSDDSTLQYQPTVLSVINYLGISASALLTVGNGNGYAIQNSINAYLLPLFNTYLKNIPNSLFSDHNCQPLAESTLLQCGPADY